MTQTKNRCFWLYSGLFAFAMFLAAGLSLAVWAAAAILSVHPAADYAKAISAASGILLGFTVVLAIAVQGAEERQ